MPKGKRTIELSKVDLVSLTYSVRDSRLSVTYTLSDETDQFNQVGDATFWNEFPKLAGSVSPIPKDEIPDSWYELSKKQRDNLRDLLAYITQRLSKILDEEPESIPTSDSVTGAKIVDARPSA